MCTIEITSRCQSSSPRACASMNASRSCSAARAGTGVRSAARSQRDAFAVGGDLVGEQGVVAAGPVLGLARPRLADQLGLRLVDRDRVAGVQEVLDPVAAVGAHVVGDPLGGRGTRDMISRSTAPSHSLFSNTYPWPRQCAITSVWATRLLPSIRYACTGPGVEDQLVDPLLAALVAPVVRRRTARPSARSSTAPAARWPRRSTPPRARRGGRSPRARRTRARRLRSARQRSSTSWRSASVYALTEPPPPRRPWRRTASAPATAPGPRTRARCTKPATSPASSS